jgi:vacuolar-type H+-ATPase subunit I/STV1
MSDMKAEILKSMNSIVDEINHYIKTAKEIEDEKKQLLQRLQERRNELKDAHGVNTFMNIVGGFIVMEIRST